jgi:hypothetical protein
MLIDEPFVKAFDSQPPFDMSVQPVRRNETHGNTARSPRRLKLAPGYFAPRVWHQGPFARSAKVNNEQ